MKMRNGQIFRVMYLQEKLETTKKNQVYIKVSAAICVFIIIFCSLIAMCDWFVWGISILAVVAFIILDIYYIKAHKRYELEMYTLSIKDLEDRKKLAELRGEFLPDALYNYQIKPPTEELKLPISYYVSLMIAEIFIGMLLV